MKQLKLKTKQNVLNLFLNSAVKRIAKKKEETKEKEKENPCYECLKTYLL